VFVNHVGLNANGLDHMIRISDSIWMRASQCWQPPEKIIVVIGRMFHHGAGGPFGTATADTVLGVASEQENPVMI